MKILQNSDKFIDLILENQIYDKNKKYIVSPYVITVFYDDNYLVFNVLTKKLLCLSFNEINSVFTINYDNCLKLADIKYENISLIEKLINEYFIIPVDLDIQTISDRICYTARQINNNNTPITSYVIFTTTACNARCFYCFEKGTKPMFMSAETAEQLADYIIRKSQNRKIFLQWFGGEPLCNISPIDIVCNHLKNSNVDFSSEIITNGYLLNNEIIQKSKEKWNLTKTQITIDGLKDTYQKIKNYKNNDLYAYERVINNIKILLENNISVTIRLNLDVHNAKELDLLINELHIRFIDFKKLYIDIIPIYEDSGFFSIKRSIEQRKQVVNELIRLQNIVDNFGLYVPHSLPNKINVFQCVADAPNARLVSPDGKFGYCDHFPLQYQYSTIEEDKPKKAWCDYIKPLGECKKCEVYPICVRLLNCNDGRTECFEYEKIRRVRQIRLAMIEKYKKSVEYEI